MEKKRKRRTDNSTGFIGVCKTKKKYQAQIRINKKRTHLGTFDTKKEAAIAYDRAATRNAATRSAATRSAATQKNRNTLRYPLNFPNMVHNDLESLEIIQKKRRRPNKTGFIGVYKYSAKKYSAKIKVDKKQIYLGSFNTKRKAAIAFDVAAIKKGEARVNLNFPKMTHAKNKKNGFKHKHGSHVY